MRFINCLKILSGCADFIELVAKFFFGYQAHIGKVDPRAASFAEQHPQRFVCQHMKEGDGEIL